LQKYMLLVWVKAVFVQSEQVWGGSGVLILGTFLSVGVGLSILTVGIFFE
jgi:hypothetical protein